MTSRAFFSTALVLAILFTLFLVLGFSSLAASSLGQATTLAVQAEKTNFVRSELELNADRVLRGTLQEQLDQGARETNAIEDRLAANFLAFVQQSQAVPPGFPAVEFHSNAGAIDYAFLRSRFKVLLHEVNGIVFAEFHNAARDADDTIQARIRFDDYMQSFSLPPNYTVTALKVGACTP